MLNRLPTLCEQAKALSSGETSATELTNKALNLADEKAHLNMFIALDRENALLQAKASDERRAAGTLLSPIDGVPIAIKDNYLTKDYPTTACSNAKPLEHTDMDATLVANLRSAGAIIFGKTNMDEWAFSATNESSSIGAARNPHNPDHITGGSSGGSAAAVGAGVVAAALGSDTGGSIRIPAAACGVYGFKPSYGRASRYGVLPLSWSLDSPGPIASSLEDIGALLPYVLGQDDNDVTTFLAKKCQSFSHKSINLVHLAGAGLERSEEVDKIVRGSLAKTSATISDAELPLAKNYYAAWAAITFAEASLYHKDLLEKNPMGYAPVLRAKLEAGMKLTAVEVLQAQKLRSHLMQVLMSEYGDWDALVMPTLPVAIPKIGEESVEFAGQTADLTTAMLWLCFLGNLSGLPTVTMPVGLSESGLPVSVMLLGRPGKDEELLSMAMELEKSMI